MRSGGDETACRGVCRILGACCASMHACAVRMGQELLSTRQRSHAHRVSAAAAERVVREQLAAFKDAGNRVALLRRKSLLRDAFMLPEAGWGDDEFADYLESDILGRLDRIFSA